MAFVDTNVLLRLILKDDETLHQQASKIVADSDPGGLLVTNIIISEVVYVLRIQKFSREQTVASLALLLERPQFTYQKPLIDSVFRYFEETKLDFADCYLLVRSLREGRELKTLDQPLKKAYTHQKLLFDHEEDPTDKRS